jgi:hypothetical protein
MNSAGDANCRKQHLQLEDGPEDFSAIGGGGEGGSETRGKPVRLQPHTWRTEYISQMYTV